MLKKEKTNLKSLLTPRKGSQPRSYMPIISSIRACSEGFNIMSSYPCLEFKMFNEQGKLRKTY